MAGDWIKMRSNLKDDPDVVVMAGRLETDEFSVVGRLHAVWAWLDQHSQDGLNVRITSAYLDRLTACPGFADAMRAVGWLDGRDGSLLFPSFGRHNGESAKVRATETKRKAAQREGPREERRDKCPADAGTGDGTGVPKNLGPEKRREEIENTVSPSPRARKAAAGEVPDEVPDELLTQAQAAAQAQTAGVAEDFARYVFEDWHSRGGRDSGGVRVAWAGYVKKRWNREQGEWIAGTHRGKNNGGPKNGQRKLELDRDRDRTGLATTAGDGLRTL